MSDADNTDAPKTDKPADSVRDKQQIGKSDILKYIDNQTLRTNPFERSVTAEQIYKRAERIAAALFLVTSHVHDTEPLKSSIRSGSIKLLDQALSVHLSLRSEESPESHILLSAIRTLISEVRLLGVAGYVSHPNVAVLVSALDEMGHLLVSAQRSSLSDFHALTHDDLIPPIAPAAPESARRPRERSVKDTIPNKGHTDSAPRSERIIALLRTKDLMGIKDISLNLPEYSEKMIQRELADLVESGRVRKIGAKRWSRYGYVR